MHYGVYNNILAAELQTLIEYAKSLNINFVYSLSPGMDIEYSKVKDISAVKAKLEQVGVTYNTFVVQKSVQVKK